MSKFTTRALLGASALVSAFAAAAAANAQSTATTIYGGGSSLLAPYWRQAGDCYGVAVTLYSKTSATTAPTVVTTNPPPSACTPGSNTVQYISTGSGTGIAAVYSHDSSQYGPPAGATSGSIFPTVNYGLSDNSLVTADWTVWKTGGTEQGLTFNSSGATGTFPIPLGRFGQLVQFPVSIDPVALAYNPVYATVGGVNHSLQVNSSFANGNGGLRLSRATYCGIFNHTITDWGDSHLTADNGGQSLLVAGDTSAPITIVGRSDSSGTTSIFTRNLAAVCNAVAPSTNHYTTGATTISAAANATIQGFYTLASGSGGVATAIHSTNGAIGYIGPDYALPFVTATGTNTFNLNVAAVQNSALAYSEPSVLGARAAFGSVAPPTGSSETDPTQWVQSTAASAPLADPTGTQSYPIVGTTNFLGYSCYASADALAVVKAFVTFDLTETNAQNILKAAGLSPLPTAWTDAITGAFVTGDSQQIAFAQAGTSSVNPGCASVAGG